jgi:hypothetical protein
MIDSRSQCVPSMPYYAHEYLCHCGKLRPSFRGESWMGEVWHALLRLVFVILI